MVGEGRGGGERWVAGQEEGGGVAGAGLTCPLGPGSPDSPCRYRAAGSGPAEGPGPAPRPAGRPRAARSPSRLSLPGGRPPPGRPANEAQRVRAPADPHPPPPPPGTRGGEARLLTTLPRGPVFPGEPCSKRGVRDLMSSPLQGWLGPGGPRRPTPGPGHTPLQLRLAPQGRAGPAPVLLPGRPGALKGRPN